MSFEHFRYIFPKSVLVGLVHSMINSTCDDIVLYALPNMTWRVTISGHTVRTLHSHLTTASSLASLKTQFPTISNCEGVGDH